MLSGPGDTWLYRFAHTVIPPVFTRLYRMEVRGLEHVPRFGAVVLACNHVANIDPVFLGVACQRHVHFMAKSELWKFRPLGWLVNGLGAFPVRRGEADRDAVRRALELLDQQAVVGIFPEGTRQPEGRLGQLQTGVALLSLRPGVTTIPVMLRGTNHVVRNRRPSFPRVSATFGPPVPALSAGGARAERHREFTARLMTALQDLLDQTGQTGVPVDGGVGA
ncbi:MAG: 1-acyl-sn-glycerol-3-phosphate acyltransferase [Thermoleophilia bacterium]|nr:1-acyl-sn-glycerol-3-phosphate acyltransferase [Thermoleophilia bacterium]